MLIENRKKSKKVDAPSNLPSREGFDELVRRIAEGSEAAVWELLERYSKNILRLVRRHLPTEIRTKVDSVDIVQSVWKSLLRTGVPLNHIASADDFVAYLAGAARLKVFEAHRHYTRCEATNIRREVPLTSPSATGLRLAPSPPTDHAADRKHQTPSALVCARDNWERAIAKAGVRGQEAVHLRLQGLTLDEIADRMSLSKSTVRRILDSVLQSLSA